MRKVELRMNEQIKYDIIKRVANNEISVRRAAVKLGVTIRTVYNLIKTYRTKGKAGFIHGNRGRKPSTTISKEVTEKILSLYKNTYYQANFKHFLDLLKERENIEVSYYYLYKLLSKERFISPKCTKKTLRRINKELSQKLKSNAKLTQAEKDYIAATNLQDPSKAHPRKPRAKYAGELILMDASEHVWFGNYKTHLHLCLDDASGQIVGAYFDSQETLKGYYNTLYQVLTKYGIPAIILTDNRSIFKGKGIKNPSADEKDMHTQFGYACHQLGIELRTTSIPQAKGRIERMFQTLQSRLILELKLAGITSIQEANKFLENYIKKFNQQFAVQLDYTKSVYDTQLTSEKINYTLAVISKRIVDNGSSIKYKNKYYQFYLSGSLVAIKPKTRCYVLEAFDGSLLASIGEEIYELHELESNYKVSKIFDLEEPKKPKYRGHKPKDCHPWKYFKYKRKSKRITA